MWVYFIILYFCLHNSTTTLSVGPRFNSWMVSEFSQVVIYYFSGYRPIAQNPQIGTRDVHRRHSRWHLWCTNTDSLWSFTLRLGVRGYRPITQGTWDVHPWHHRWMKWFCFLFANVIFPWQFKLCTHIQFSFTCHVFIYLFFSGC